MQSLPIFLAFFLSLFENFPSYSRIRIRILNVERILIQEGEWMRIHARSRIHSPVQYCTMYMCTLYTTLYCWAHMLSFLWRPGNSSYPCSWRPGYGGYPCSWRPGYGGYLGSWRPSYSGYPCSRRPSMTVTLVAEDPAMPVTLVAEDPAMAVNLVAEYPIWKLPL